MNALVAVDDGAEGVDAFAVDEDVDFDEVGRLLAVLVVVKRRVPFGVGFELVEEVKDDFAYRDAVVQVHAFGADVLHVLHLAAMFLA